MTLLLASSGPQDSTLQKGGSAGFLALLLVVLMGVAVVLLIRNMSARLKRLPREFPDQPDRGAATRSPDDPSSPRT